VDLLRTLGGVDRVDCGVGVWHGGFVPQLNIAPSANLDVSVCLME
jgi:hypothetical protein